jgi:hypothetical protein
MRPLPTLNHKQEELLHTMFEKVHERFPNIERHEVSYFAEDKEHIILYVISYLSEEDEIAMMNYSGEITADILMETGYYLSMLPRAPEFA